MEFKYFDISENVSPDELKQQYRKLSMQHHPDKGGDKDVFQHISKEYREALEMIKQKAYRQNDINLYKIINEQIYSIDGYINKLNVPDALKPSITLMVEKGINELGSFIRQKLRT